MDARARTTGLVAVAAAVAAAVTVGATALQSRGDDGTPPAASTPRAGPPPLALELGIRRDAEAHALRRAAAALNDGKVDEAVELFRGSPSLEARVGLALAAWPERTFAELERLGRANPESALVHVNLGSALLWAGRVREARAAWRRAILLEPDSPYAIRADDLLHLETFPGLPPFVLAEGFPASVRRLPPERQLRVLARAAKRGGTRDRLLYGVALQQAGRPVSAQQQFTAAARSAPTDPEALTADAVGRFRKSRPTPAFARLGPLTRRFPRAPVVRLHLGLLLLWLGEREEARPQLERAVALGPDTVYGRQAGRFVRALGQK